LEGALSYVFKLFGQTLARLCQECEVIIVVWSPSCLGYWKLDGIYLCML